MAEFLSLAQAMEATMRDGDVVAMESYGASAPAKVLYEHFGFTGQAIADRARTVLERTRA